MAFLVSDRSLADAYREIKTIMGRLRADLTNESANMGSQGANFRQIEALFRRIKDDRSQLDGLKGVRGLARYAKDQQDDQSYAIGTEFTTALANLEAIQDRILLVLPTGTGGWLLGEKLDKTVGRTWRDFTPAQTASLKSSIDTFLATLS